MSNCDKELTRVQNHIAPLAIYFNNHFSSNDRHPRFQRRWFPLSSVFSANQLPTGETRLRVFPTDGKFYYHRVLRAGSYSWNKPRFHPRTSWPGRIQFRGPSLQPSSGSESLVFLVALQLFRRVYPVLPRDLTVDLTTLSLSLSSLLPTVSIYPSLGSTLLPPPFPSLNRRARTRG